MEANEIKVNIMPAGEEYRRYEFDGDNVYLYISKEYSGEYVKRHSIFRGVDNIEEISDISISVDEKTKNHYMFYKKADGIYGLCLNPRNGLAHFNGYGKLVAARPQWVRDAIGRPIVRYNKETEYYYLFVNYGNEMDSNIRVARSRNITGPYVDSGKRAMTNPADFCQLTGNMILSSFKFDGDEPIKAVLNNVTNEEEWCLKADNRKYKIIWQKGWPCITPKLSQEDTAIEEKNKEEIYGRYEFVKLVPMTPQGCLNTVFLNILKSDQEGMSSTRNDWAYKIEDNMDGRIEIGGSVRGGYRILDQNTVEFSFANCKESYKLYRGHTIYMTGIDNNGVTSFAKKIREL